MSKPPTGREAFRAWLEGREYRVHVQREGEHQWLTYYTEAEAREAAHQALQSGEGYASAEVQEWQLARRVCESVRFPPNTVRSQEIR